MRNPLDFLRARKLAYIRAFSGPGQADLVEDLARFCRAHTTCWHPDPRIHAVLEGRREVWLRIQEHLRLSDAQLAAIYQANIRKEQGDDN